MIFSALIALAALQAPPRLGDDRVVLRTPCGDLVLAMYPDVAPKTAAQVLALARAGAYDGTRFRPAVPGAYLQAFGHTTRSTSLSPEAAELVRRLPLESGVVPHRRGELSMSRSPEDAGSAESSFSIILGDQPGYDGRYAVFGRVVAGWEVLTLLESVAQRDPGFSLSLERAEVLSSPSGINVAALRPPTPPPPPPTGRIAAVLAGWVVLLGAGGAMAWLPARWFASRTRTWALVGVLIAAFPLFVVSLAMAPNVTDRRFALVVFASAFVFFRIMARFEGPPPPSRPSATAT